MKAESKKKRKNERKNGKGTPVCRNKRKGKCALGRQNKKSTRKSTVRANITASQQGGA